MARVCIQYRMHSNLFLRLVLRSMIDRSPGTREGERHEYGGKTWRLLARVTNDDLYYNTANEVMDRGNGECCMEVMAVLSAVVPS